MNSLLPSPKIFILYITNFHTTFSCFLQKFINIPLSSVIRTFDGIFSKNMASKVFLSNTFKFIAAIHVPISSGLVVVVKNDEFHSETHSATHIKGHLTYTILK